MKAIIFGANGQDGFYLTELLHNQQIEVNGINRRNGDVADWVFVENTIKTEKPNYIFHLAANSTTSHEALFDNHSAISTGTINILESVKRHSPETKVFLSGSAVQFENTGGAITENTPFAPLSPYAVSRIHSVYAARYYRSFGLKIYVGYFFNHDSPRRTEQHVNQKIAQAARRIANGSREKLELGDISVEKEFNFAGDAVRAVWILVNQTKITEAVVGSGTAHSIKEWLDLCFARFNLDWRDYVIIKENFTPEYRILVSNPALIKSLGWQPQFDIQDLARMMTEE